ncbi:hypothetical protein COO91_03556 [Nostoc flagelliforme CCNUN1]|uniref:Uncharacterized protein n=1 Tax=Nostoc flagelliforme CCNUN1 TaxID=2038116 RepID=A0A2K8SQI6_9NOSO|nr:hypothetical protein COO91_03556 [Nostoc flagelliforme CCNUN1]
MFLGKSFDSHTTQVFLFRGWEIIAPVFYIKVMAWVWC